MNRDIEELRAIAITRGQTLDKLEYEMLNDGMKELEHLQNLIDKATNYYLKTLAKNGSMPEEAVEMFNLLEKNK